jgi:hypothetical protein
VAGFREVFAYDASQGRHCQARLTGLPASVLDARPTETTWTLREVVHHVARVTNYANAIGAVSPTS